MINVVICGAAGRMGKENIIVFNDAKEIAIVGAVETHNSNYIGQDAGHVAGLEGLGVTITSKIEDVIQRADVIVDFTAPEATLKTLKTARIHGKGMVIGTTGFTKDHIEIIKKNGETIPILLSPNMSQGVNILIYLARRAAELLGKDYEVEILEIHHNRKKDAPSGTALQLGDEIAQAREISLNTVGSFSRHGIVGERKKSEIGFSSIRLSDVVGEHTIMFGGPGERIELSHKSSSRKNYSNGALRAVKFIAEKKVGFFTMKDVLGIS
ncbi:MAG: 4-hydroxy-tetrahydrodipicolinate reductase [Spirochaetes bacterium DG_61]|jgi:4-hydroxy-tetrahydrodipicolinate reductase|nr:MAG: 4-hydroxy-tetrahydrodipicolinate reductase [Spirochaetes bacterium DG_61]